MPFDRVLDVLGRSRLQCLFVCRCDSCDRAAGVGEVSRQESGIVWAFVVIRSGDAVELVDHISARKLLLPQVWGAVRKLGFPFDLIIGMNGRIIRVLLSQGVAAGDAAAL